MTLTIYASTNRDYRIRICGTHRFDACKLSCKIDGRVCSRQVLAAEYVYSHFILYSRIQKVSQNFGFQWVEVIRLKNLFF